MTLKNIGLIRKTDSDSGLHGERRDEQPRATTLIRDLARLGNSALPTTSWKPIRASEKQDEIRGNEQMAKDSGSQ
jgi:hypothetical protein